VTAHFDFEPERALATLDRMRTAPEGAVSISGESWAQAAMGALVQAELLAAQAGVVPWLELPDGEKGVLSIGKALESIDRAPEEVRTLYLATHRIVRTTHASAALAGPDAPNLGEPVSISVALVVLGVAAIIGAAWYFTQSAQIEVQGRNVRTTALLAEATRLAHAELATTGKISTQVWEVFKTMADDEAGVPWVPVVLGGVTVLGVVGGVALWLRSRAGGA
jgi:hypothetical protein